MPKPPGNRKKAKGDRKGAAKGSNPTQSADQLYEQAQHALAVDDYDAAKDCLKEAVQLEPDNVELLDAYGALLSEVGPQSEAVQVSKT